MKCDWCGKEIIGEPLKTDNPWLKGKNICPDNCVDKSAREIGENFMPTPYCVNCQTWMDCSRNGVTIPYPTNRTVTGDEYTCLSCKRAIIYDWGEPVYIGTRGE